MTQILRQAVTEQPDLLGTVYQGRRRTWRKIGVRVLRSILRDPYWAGHARKI